MKLHFNRDHVKKLLDLSLATKTPQPILEQIISPQYWRTDMNAKRSALLDGESQIDGFAFSANAGDVDLDKIPKGLILVGDKGIYLMSQAPRVEVEAAGVSHVAYAKEADPLVLHSDIWYDNKRAAFGGDDGTILLSEEHVRKGLQLAGDHFVVDLTPRRFEIITTD